MTERVLLDTDVFSYMYGKRSEFEGFRPLLAGKTLCLSFITIGELLYGARRANWGSKRFEELRNAFQRLPLIPYTPELPEIYGELVAACEQAGCQIMLNDAWIAATAIAYGLRLATNNIRHYERIDGLFLLHPDLKQESF